jgi:hypothetical protein
MADDNIADIVKQMSDSTRSQPQHDWKAQQKAARDERIDEQAAVARRVAAETINENDRRNEAWLQTHLGNLTASEFRAYCQQRYGYDPGV